MKGAHCLRLYLQNPLLDRIFHAIICTLSLCYMCTLGDAQVEALQLRPSISIDPAAYVDIAGQESEGVLGPQERHDGIYQPSIVPSLHQSDPLHISLSDAGIGKAEVREVDPPQVSLVCDEFLSRELWQSNRFDFFTHLQLHVGRVRGECIPGSAGVGHYV